MMMRTWFSGRYHTHLPSSYPASTSSSSRNPARRTQQWKQRKHTREQSIFSRRILPTMSVNVFGCDKCSMEDVQDALTHAKAKYENSKQSKAWKWLTRPTSRIMLYENFLVIIAQLHPDYAFLAWGAIKFVLQVAAAPNSFPPKRRLSAHDFLGST